MFPAFVLRCLASIIVILSSVVSLSAAVEEEEWARAMVDKDLLKINFKSVAKGQDVSFKIPVKNIYKEDMQVTGLSTSCGCISWNENRPGPNGVINPIIIPSGQTQILTLTLDTIKHPGEHKGKKAVITFFEPTKGAVGTATIVVEGYVRTDVVRQVAPHDRRYRAAQCCATRLYFRNQYAH